MEHIINIIVRNKIAKDNGGEVYVCDNSDYVVEFDLDSEWDEFDVKTARFSGISGSAHPIERGPHDEAPRRVILSRKRLFQGVFGFLFIQIIA